VCFSVQAHSICLLQGNEAHVDESLATVGQQSWTCDVQEEDSPYDDWVAGMLVQVTRGPHLHAHAVLERSPAPDGSAEVRLLPRDASASAASAHSAEDLGVLRVDCRNLQLLSPQRRARVVVLAGPLQGHVGRVQAIFSAEREVVLDNLPSTEIIPLSNVACLHTRFGNSSSSGGGGGGDRGGDTRGDEGNSSAVSSSRNRESGGGAAHKCLLCNQGGVALVRNASRRVLLFLTRARSASVLAEQRWLLRCRKHAIYTGRNKYLDYLRS
jgi:hypothetical protein